jgi:hypothetical protein
MNLILSQRHRGYGGKRGREEDFLCVLRAALFGINPSRLCLRIAHFLGVGTMATVCQNALSGAHNHARVSVYSVRDILGNI